MEAKAGELTDLERLFLKEFADHKRLHYGAPPSWATIGSRIGISRQWARTLARRLIDAGVLRMDADDVPHLAGESAWEEPEWMKQ